MAICFVSCLSVMTDIDFDAGMFATPMSKQKPTQRGKVRWGLSSNSESVQADNKNVFYRKYGGHGIHSE